MFWPASAWRRARAERKMVSPSGIGSSDSQQCAPVVEALRRQMETGILEEGSEEMMRRRLTVDGRDQHAAPLVFAALHVLLRQSRQELAQVTGGDGAVRLISGQEDLQAGVPAPQVGHQFSVAQHHAGAYAAGEHTRAVFLFTRGPTQHRAI